jgi:hypothetical protein
LQVQSGGREAFVEAIGFNTPPMRWLVFGRAMIRDRDAISGAGFAQVLSDGIEVHFDLLGSGDRKLAGAGQRRSRHGLLHQGSVAANCDEPVISQKRSKDFAARLASGWEEISLFPEMEDIARRVATRYARDAWTNRR